MTQPPDALAQFVASLENGDAYEDLPKLHPCVLALVREVQAGRELRPLASTPTREDDKIVFAFDKARAETDAALREVQDHG